MLWNPQNRRDRALRFKVAFRPMRQRALRFL